MSLIHKYKFFSILFLAILIGAGSCNESNTNAEIEVDTSNEVGFGLHLFSLLSADKTGIHFMNNIVENEKNNFYDFDYMYNGSGVAIGDINNDGLADIYFAGNMVSNKLYLNKGKMVFEDITEKAGVNGNNGWTTGVTMADINGDGYLDIYVCRSYSDEDAEPRKNLLYINNGDKTFSERGKAYGINDSAYSTQATFFDYDLDGDLDLFLGNHPREIIVDNFQRRMDKWKNIDPFDSDKLYRNNNDGTFSDVTEQAGLLNFCWTLGIVVGDINDDGYPDIYISNDYAEPDMLYMNNKDGTFSNVINKGIKHISNFGMGTDLADFNNDGLLDIVVLDMMARDNYRQKTNMSAMEPYKFWAFVKAGYHYQYMRNTLQLNNGNGSFSEIGQLSGMHYTDWSWAALFCDFDNDGFKDLFISNGYRRDSRNSDFRVIHNKNKQEALNRGEVLLYPTLSDYLSLMPVKKIINYLFINNGDLTFSDRSIQSGFTVLSFSNGAAYGDLDNDGDMDLVVNNLMDTAFIYQNNASLYLNNNYLRFELKGDKPNIFGLGTKITIKYDGKVQYQELTLTRGFQSSVECILHFGLGGFDQVEEVIVVWPNGKMQILNDVATNQVLTLYQKDANTSNPEHNSVQMLFSDFTTGSGVDFIHHENEYDDYKKESLLPHKMSQFGPNFATGDVNGDGLEDFYVGGASWQAGVLYIQKNNLTFKPLIDQPWDKDKNYEDIGCVLFDSDNDGDLDLYVVSGGNEFSDNSPLLQDRLYLNEGNGKFTKSTGKLPNMLTSGSCVVPGDFDGDGDLDLFIGGRLVPGKYPFPARSYILKNDHGVFTDVTAAIAPDLFKPGMVTSAVWTDFDSNGKMDLIVVGEWMPISFFRNTGKGFENLTASYDMDNTTGWWNKIAMGDIDSDGDMDYVVGNLGLNYKYKATEKEPLHVYCHDFDNSGTLDIVLGYYNQGTCYPVRGRQCSYEQMPFIKEKFSSYDAYGKASISEVYGQGLYEALHYEAKMFASCYIENEGTGNFSVQPLPVEAQFSTVNGIIVKDFDGDENLDILLAGNLFVSEMETGRADAGIGLYLKGNGRGEFTPVNVMESGFFADHDVKDLAIIYNINNQPLILVANNDDKVQLYNTNILDSNQLNKKLVHK